MRSIKILLVFVLTSVVAHAGSTEAYQKMVSINAEWVHYAPSDILDIDPMSLETDEDWIQLHLLSVHNTLSKVDVSNLTPTQRKNRETSLSELLEYAQVKEFPHNRSFSGRRPVFIDHRRVHCAVGHLVTQSGYADISQRISLETNYAYLRNIKDDGLNQWVEASGFSVNELAWIQPSYYQPINFQSLKGGLNGPVNTIIANHSGGLFVGGKFDSADQSSAGNIASYFSGIAGFDWTGVGTSGLNGEVHDAIIFKGELYVAGRFNVADTVPTSSGVVKWDGTKWVSLGGFYVGAMNSYVNDLEIYRDTLYAGGLFRSNSSWPAADFFSAIAKWDGTNWVATQVLVTGEVKALHVHDKKLFVGGDFQLNTGAPRNNMCFMDSLGMQFLPSPTIPVNDIETYNNEVYIATDFMDSHNTDTMGLAVYRNNTWEVIFDGSNTSKLATGGIKTLKAIPSNNALALGGDFVLSPFLGNTGKNIALYRGGNHIVAFGALDSTVRTMAVVNNSLYMGGDFTYASFTAPGVKLNHIAQVAITPNFSVEEESLADVDVYPNPAKDNFLLRKSGEPWKQFEIFDMQGRSHKVPIVENEEGWQFDVSGLAKGTYILSMKNDGSSLEKKIVIQ